MEGAETGDDARTHKSYFGDHCSAGGGGGGAGGGGGGGGGGGDEGDGEPRDGDGECYRFLPFCIFLVRISAANVDVVVQQSLLRLRRVRAAAMEVSSAR